MALSEIQRNRLLAYVQQKDRETEPVYVGREDLFTLVAGNAKSAARGKPKGLTTCIAGPPGVGKTAFLDELARRTQTADAWDGPPMACIPVDPADLHAPNLVLDAVMKWMPKQWRRPLEDLRNALSNIKGASLGGGFAGFTLTAGATWRTPGNASTSMPWEASQSIASRMPLGSVLCLVVDEAQKLSDTPGSDHNVLLRSLHMARSGGMRVPIFVVLAGLTHATDVIGRSVSRLAEGNERFMRGLSEAESLEYVNSTLDHFRVNGSDPGRPPLARWIANECGGFPHHLRNAMELVAKGLFESGSLDLSVLNGAAVAKRLADRRHRYYQKRTEGAVSEIKRNAGRLLRDWSKGPAPHDKAEGRAAIRRLLRELDSEQRESLAEQGVGNAFQLMDQMIRNGLVIVDDDGCRCPIDSMVSWLESDGRRHKLRAEFPKLAGAGPKPKKGRNVPSP